MEGGAGEKKKERSAIRNSQFAIRNPQSALPICELDARRRSQFPISSSFILT